jgi:uncharacterized protein (DUF2336 family)
MHSMTKIDTQQLLDLARDKTVEGRQALTATVTDLFFSTGDALTDRERALMTEILRQLISDAEISIRTALAERLSQEPDAPREIILALANDQISVAYPILLKSTVLHDDELIEIILHRTLEHQLAIAMRALVTEPVSDALVKAKNTSVIRTLLENHGAAISAATLAYLVEQSKTVDSYQNPLLHRNDLGVNLSRRMYAWVGEALRQHILAKFPVVPAVVDAALAASIAETAEAVSFAETTKAVKLAKDVSDIGIVTPTLLIKALREGEVALFEALFATLSGLRLTMVRQVLFDRTGQKLAIVCRALGMPPTVFNTIYALVRASRPTEAAITKAEARDVVVFYENTGLAPALQLLKSWQENRTS